MGNQVTTRWVYSFGDGKAEGRAEMKNLLGGKGAGLAEMSNLGLPVPPGFTITTEVCTYYYENGQTYPADLKDQVDRGAGRRRTEHRRRLRRSGEPAAGLGALRRPRLHARHDGHRPQPRPQRRHGRRAWRGAAATRASPMTATAASSRCTATSCSASSITISRSILENHEATTAASQLDTELTADDWQELVVEATRPWSSRSWASRFPQDPEEQLWGAIGAVFGSWKNPRAVTYRRLHDIPAEWGTAVNVQAMVFGNMGDDCATGVAFTRNPSTGEQRVLRRISGQRPGRGRRRRHPHAAASDHRRQAGQQVDLPAMEEVMPEVFGELDAVRLQARRATTATCRTSSSRSSRASSACCRPAPASARPRRRSRSPSTWSTRA